MKRYHCSICSKKRNESELIKISSDLHKKEVWTCRNHTSNFADISHIRTSEQKPMFLELFSGSAHISNHAATLGFDYYKPTDIWTNCKDFKPKQIRGCMGVEFENSVKDLPNAYERSLIPPGLICEVFDSFKNKFVLPGSVNSESG